MLDRTNWPPSPRPTLELRERLLDAYRKHPSLLSDAKKYYARNSADFVNTWVDTYDPRNAGRVGRSPRMPFILFPRQWELFGFFEQLLEEQASGLIEKSRDMGATWAAGGFSVAKLLFVEGSSIGWGSRKADLVDNGAGDMDSIFEKMRYTIRSIPSVFYPKGFDVDSMPYMKITSPLTESSITGESGDNIGRGGRKRAYFKDESAHYERPELIEAALGDNTNVQIDISSVHGLGNVFHRKREGGTDWEPGDPMYRDRTNVFVMDWSDHPDKDAQWYKMREDKARDEGLLHVFRQEVDRDYSASIEGTIVPAEWLRACVDAHLKIPGMLDGPYSGALDVADDTADNKGDSNAWSLRKFVTLIAVDEWGDRDTGESARRAVMHARELGQPIKVQYDCIGVGSGVKAETNRLAAERIMPKNVKFVSWDAGSSPLYPDQRVVTLDNGNEDPESSLNKEFYGNLKAQGWWMLRRRAEKTFNFITKGKRYPVGELISIDSKIPKLRQVLKEISQPTVNKTVARLKLYVEKTPKGTRSPNIGDSVMMNYWPVDDRWGYDVTMSGV
jgi:phage terminase large subunit